MGDIALIAQLSHAPTCIAKGTPARAAAYSYHVPASPLLPSDSMTSPLRDGGRCTGKGGAFQQKQAQAWRELLDWEKSNPQRMDGPALSARVSLAYDEAVTVLMHYPDVGPFFVTETPSS